MEKLMSEEELKRLHKTEIEILDDFVSICEKNNLTYFLVGGTLLGAVRHKGFIPWDDDLDIGMPRDDYEKFINKYAKELGDKYTLDNKNTNSKYYLNFTKIRKKGTIFEQDFQINYDGPKGIWIDIFAFDNAKSRNSFKTYLQVKLNKIIFNILHYKNDFYIGNRCIKFKKIIGKIFSKISNKRLLDIQDNIQKWNSKHNEYEFMLPLATSGYYKDELLNKDVYLPVHKIEFEGKMYNAPNNPDYILKNRYGNYMEIPPKEKRITHRPVKLEFGE